MDRGERSRRRLLRGFLSFFVGLVVVAVSLPVSPVRASANSLSLTASSATVAPGAQVTLTAGMPVIGAGTVSQEIVQTIDPTKMKLTSASDIRYPAGWTPRYCSGAATDCTNGANFSASAPSDAAAWANVKAVKAAGSVVSSGSASGLQISTGTASTDLVPPTGSFSANMAGADPWTVVFDTDGRVFAMSHHSTFSSGAILKCFLRSGSACTNWSGLTASSLASNMKADLWMDAQLNRIWFPTNTSTSRGFGCVSVPSDAAPTLCSGSGFTQSGFVAIEACASNACDQYGETTIIREVDKRLFTFGSNGKLYCLDVSSSAPAPCSGAGYVSGVSSSAGYTFSKTTDNSSAGSGFMEVVNGNLYALGASNTNAYMSCTVPLTGLTCAGWTNQSTVDPWTTGWLQNKYYVTEMLVYPDANGNATAICYMVRIGTRMKCMSLSGATYTPSAAFTTKWSQVSGSGLYGNGPISIGSKFYFHAGSGTAGAVTCVDAAASWASCSGFTAPTVINYSIVRDPLNATCIWAAGDTGGAISTFDSASGGACAAKPASLTFNVDTIVPRMGCSSSGAITSWSNFVLSSPSSSGYTSATLNIIKADGSTAYSYPLTSGSVDLASASVSTTGQNPVFKVEFTGLTSTGAATASVTAVGDAPQLCLTPTAQVVCPTGTGPLTGLAASSMTASTSGSSTNASSSPTTLDPVSTAVTISAPTEAQCGATLSGAATLSGTATGVGGATVTLLDSSGNPILVNGSPVTTTTAADGTYSFGYVFPGTYKVRFADAGTKTGSTTTVTAGGSGTTSRLSPSVCSSGTTVQVEDPAGAGLLRQVTSATVLDRTTPLNIVTNGDLTERPVDASGNAVAGGQVTITTPSGYRMPGWTHTGGGASTYARWQSGGGALTPAPASPDNFYFGNQSGWTTTPTFNPATAFSPGGVTQNSYTFTPGYAGFGDNANPVKISQTLATTVGRTYRLQFWQASEPWGSTDGIAALELTGYTRTYFRVNGTDSSRWGRYTFEFVATSTSTTLAFMSWGHIGVTADELRIDDIIVNRCGDVEIDSASAAVAVGTNGVVNASYITPAVASNDTSSGVLGAAQTINVKANDVAATGNNLTSPTINFCSTDSPPSGCTLTTKTVAGQGAYSLSGGNVVFTPCSAANTPAGAGCTGAFSGTATAVGYQITDSGGQTAVATITPSVVPPPTAGADTSSGAYNTAQTKNLLTNDSAGSGATLSASTLRLCNPTTTPAQTPNNCTVAAGTTINVPNVGSYVVDSSGVVTFTPLASFTGSPPALSYQVQDNLNQFGSSTYTPTVTPPAAPVVVADTSTGIVGAVQTKNVLTNDAGSVSGQSLTTNTVRLCGSGQVAPGCDKTSVVVAGVGSYALNTSTGVVTFTPCNGVNTPVMSPACTGVFTGTPAGLGYQVTSNTNQTASSTYTPTVVPGPTTAADVGTGAWDTNQTFTPLSNDAAGAGTTLVSSPAGICSTSTAVSSCTGSSLSVANEGTYTLNGDGSVTFDPLPSFTGMATPIRYVAVDALGQKAASTITPSVTPPGAPSATAETKVVLPGASVGFTNVIGASGLGSGTALKSGASGGPCLVDPSDSVCKTSFTVAGEGSWSINQSTGVATFTALASAPAGTLTAVTYRITDGVGQTATSTLTPRIPAVPVAVDDSSTGKYDTNQVLSPLTNDTADDATPLVVSSLKLCGAGQSPPGCDKTSVAVAGEGTYTLGSDGKVTFDPLPSFTGAATPLRYQVSDAAGRVADALLKPTVSPTAAPTAVADVSRGLWDVNQVLSPLVNDTADAATPLVVASLKLCGAGQSPPACDKSSVTVAGEGTYTLGSDGKVTFDPLPSFTGTATAVRYQVADSLGRVVDSTVTPTVLPPPVARPDTSQGEMGERQVVSLTGNDDQGAPGQALDLASVRLCGAGEVSPACSKTQVVVPGEGTYAVNVDGTIDFVPEPKFVGTSTAVPYVVSDVLGQKVASTVTVIVVPPPAPIAVVDLVAGRQGEVLVFSPWLNDSGGEIPKGVDGTVDVVPSSIRLCGDGEAVPKCTQTTLTTADGTYTVDVKTGKVSFVHVPGFVGRVQSPPTYQISNDWKGASGSKIASSVLIPTILPPPTPEAAPVALPDSSQGRKGKSQTLPVLGNDAAAATAFDPTSVRLCGAGETAPGCTATSLTVAGEGTYVVGKNGEVVFTPEPAFLGTATPQRYVVADKSGKKASSTVTVRVLDQPVPAAVLDTGRAKQGNKVELSPWLNDDAGGDGASLVPTSIRLCGPGESVPNCTKLRLATADGVYSVDAKTGKVTFVHKAGFTGEVTEPVNYQIANNYEGDAGPGYAVGVLKPSIFVSAAKVFDQVNWTTPSTPVWLNPTFRGKPSKGATFVASSVRLKRGNDAVESLTTSEGVWEVIRGVVRFTPKDGFTGRTAAVPFEVTDTAGAAVGATLRVTVDDNYGTPGFLPETGQGLVIVWWASMMLLAGVVLRRLRRFV